MEGRGGGCGWRWRRPSVTTSLSERDWRLNNFLRTAGYICLSHDGTRLFRGGNAALLCSVWSYMHAIERCHFMWSSFEMFLYKYLEPFPRKARFFVLKAALWVSGFPECVKERLLPFSQHVTRLLLAWQKYYIGALLMNCIPYSGCWFCASGQQIPGYPNCSDGCLRWKEGFSSLSCLTAP